MPSPPALFHRLTEFLERSRHAFLAGLVVALAVEMAVDWNTALSDINTLRAALRAKATHYAAILRLAAEAPVAAGDGAQLHALERRVLEDPEVVSLRVADAQGRVLAEEGRPLGRQYPRQVNRDVNAMVQDPELFRRRIAASHHRDTVQAITDAQEWVLHQVGVSPSTAAGAASLDRVAYQDRLYVETAPDPDDAPDRTLVWALGLVQPTGEAAPRGVVLVALRTEAVQAATQRKVIKALALTVFFLAFILVQQLAARREKLRMLSLRDTLATARSALRAALPDAVPALPGLAGGVFAEQAERLGGTVFDFRAPSPGQLDIFVGLPEGSGVDVALASALVRDEQRRVWREDAGAVPEVWVDLLVQAVAAVPIHRRLALAALRADLESGCIHGVLCGVEPPLVLDSQGGQLSPVVTAHAVSSTAGMLEPPACGVDVAFPPGATLVFHSDGLPSAARHPVPRPELLAAVRRAGNLPPPELAQHLGKLTVKRAGRLEDDVLVVVLRRDA